MCNLPTDFLQTCRGSTNIIIQRRLTKIINNRWDIVTKIINNRWVWLECGFFPVGWLYFLF